MVEGVELGTNEDTGGQTEGYRHDRTVWRGPAMHFRRKKTGGRLLSNFQQHQFDVFLVLDPVAETRGTRPIRCISTVRDL